MKGQQFDANESLVCAIDQGTSSTRAILFSVDNWNPRFIHQVEFESEYPRSGWVQQDPLLLLKTVDEALNGVAAALVAAGGDVRRQVKAIGVTNQRETTVAWDSTTGKPLHPAIVWLDDRTKEVVARLKESFGSRPGLREKCGLPISTYFSATKMLWLLENVPEVKSARDSGRLMMGNVDTWLIWNLTGRQSYNTDVTNASRTMLMNLKSLQWDIELCEFFNIDSNVLPKILPSSSNDYGVMSEGTPFSGVAIAGCIGDQQGALVGHRCFKVGTAKSTYGTGCFMLYNVGETLPQPSKTGMLSTVGYQLGNGKPPVYALEGSIAVAGSAINWLKTIGVLDSIEETDRVASSVESTGGLAFVPAFNGLFAPHWRTDARGMMIGITQYTKKGHIVRATMEALAFQTFELLNSMEKDSNVKLESLCVDGGVTRSDTLMNTIAGFLGIPIVRPSQVEITALGAAIVAAVGAGLVTAESVSAVDTAPKESTLFQKDRDLDWDQKFQKWRRAIEKSLNWDDHESNSKL